MSISLGRWLGAVAGVAVLAGCGASGGGVTPTPSHGAAQQPLPTATQQPKPWVIAYFSGGLHFLRDDGTVLGTSATTAATDVFATANGRLWHVGDNGHLRAAAPDG